MHLRPGSHRDELVSSSHVCVRLCLAGAGLGLLVAGELVRVRAMGWVDNDNTQAQRLP